MEELKKKLDAFNCLITYELHGKTLAVRSNGSLIKNGYNLFLLTVCL